MSTVGRISIIWLPVTDLGRAVDFYTERLGLDERSRNSNWAEVEVGGVRIGLNANEQETPGDGGAVIAFQPRASLDQAVSRLREHGIEFPGEVSEHPWGRVASFKDPDGNDLQLYEPPPGNRGGG